MNKSNGATATSLGPALVLEPREHFIGGERDAHEFCLPPDRGEIAGGQVVQLVERRTVRIWPEDICDYPGAKEGVNLPIIKNGELLGVAGIYGIPEEVEQTANLLGVCVALYLDQFLAERKSQMRKDMYLSLLRRMLGGELIDREGILSAGRELSLELHLPMRAMVIISGRKAQSRQYAIESLNRMHAVAEQKGWIDSHRDVFAIFDDSFVILKHIRPAFRQEQFVSSVREELESEIGVPVTLGLGSLCSDWRHLAFSYYEAKMLVDIAEGQSIVIDSMDSKAMCLLKSCLGIGVTDWYLAAMQRDLSRGFDDKEMPTAMKTIQAYCEAECRCGLAAKKMGIHKNTMNYRINKILSLAGMESERPFVREFFLRLLYWRHRQS